MEHLGQEELRINCVRRGTVLLPVFDFCKKQGVEDPGCNGNRSSSWGGVVVVMMRFTSDGIASKCDEVLFS